MKPGTQNMVLGYEFISGSNLTFTVDTMTLVKTLHMKMILQ